MHGFVLPFQNVEYFGKIRQRWNEIKKLQLYPGQQIGHPPFVRMASTTFFPLFTLHVHRLETVQMYFLQDRGNTLDSIDRELQTFQVLLAHRV